MGKITRARRLEIILQLLKGHDEKSGLTPKEVHQRLKSEGILIDLRSVRRDLEYLSRNHGLSSSETRPERFFIAKDFEFKHTLALNEKTLQALIIALNNLKRVSHRYFEDATTEAENAILENLEPKIARELRQSKDRYYFDYTKSGRPDGKNLKDFDMILTAIRENKIIKCKNHSPYQDDAYNQRTRTFAPYIFMLSSSVPYLVVEDQEDKEIKKLRLTRVSDVELMDETFVCKDLSGKFEVESSMGGWGGSDEENIQVKITCSKMMATYFKERKIHVTQKIKALSKDRHVITFECPHSSELSRRIASFGGQVKKVEPMELFEEVKDIWASGLKSAA